MTTCGNTYCFTLISLLTVKTKEYIYTQKVFIALFRKSYNNGISGAFPYFINNETPGAQTNRNEIFVNLAYVAKYATFQYN